MSQWIFEVFDAGQNKRSPEISLFTRNLFSLAIKLYKILDVYTYCLKETIFFENVGFL